MSYRCILIVTAFGFLVCGCSLAPPSSEQRLASTYNLKLGLTYLERGQTALAKSKLLLALHETPNDALARDAMAYFLEKTGEIKKAQEYYLQAISLADANFKGAAKNNYGTYLYRQKRYEEALRYFLQAAQEPNYLNIGSAYKNAGKTALAMADHKLASLCFKKAIVHDSGVAR